MDQPTVPFKRLETFLRRLELDREGLAPLAPYRQVFTSHQDEFGKFFLKYFLSIPRTRLILEQGNTARRHRQVLSHWFGELFTRDFDHRFLTYLWRSGARHVQISLDQRFVNLGYAMVRQFCHNLIHDHIEEAEREAVAAVVDRMLDFCVLVATDSFISMTARCDRQMIEGIAHQVRNPVTVIGGNITRLQKKESPESPAYQAYAMVLAENQRLERMMADIAAYTELFQREPEPVEFSLAELISEAVERSLAKGHLPEIQLSQELDDCCSRVIADPQEMAMMLDHLLANAAEAADRDDPRVALASRPGHAPGFVELEIFNTGEAPESEELEELLGPFVSSKPMGTGMGLPIAALAVRRSLGSMSLQPAEGGVRVVVTLPLGGKA